LIESVLRQHLTDFQSYTEAFHETFRRSCREHEQSLGLDDFMTFMDGLRGQVSSQSIVADGNGEPHISFVGLSEELKENTRQKLLHLKDGAASVTVTYSECFDMMLDI
jgi:hypothetical protein